MPIAPDQDAAKVVASSRTPELACRSRRGRCGSVLCRDKLRRRTK